MSLEDKLVIHEVIARYSYTWDAKDADGFAQLFMEDAVWELVTAGETQPQVCLESCAAIAQIRQCSGRTKVISVVVKPGAV